MLLDQSDQLVFVTFFDVGENDALVRGHAKFSLELVAYRADRRFELVVFIVVQPAIFDVQTVRPFAVALFLPTHVVINFMHLVFGAIW